MNTQIFQVDAFTNKVFGGNPAAVCPLDTWIDEQLMQDIAAENNLSETAYFVPKGDHYEIRWFTPELEIDLCGHATLASAFVLFKHLGYTGDKITFRSRTDELLVTRSGNLLTLDFPSRPPEEAKIDPLLVKGLGAYPQEVFKSRDFLAVFKSEEEILSLEPDFYSLKKLDCLGIIVTAPGNEVDFVSRFFAPKAGINEDPVTGSSHTTLTPFWSERIGRNKLTARQLSGRRGELICELKGDRVLISGNAVLYMQGAIHL